MTETNKPTADFEAEAGVLIIVKPTQTPGFVLLGIEGEANVLTVNDARRLAKALEQAAAEALHPTL